MVVVIIYLISADVWGCKTYCLVYLRGLLVSEYCVTTNTGYNEYVIHKLRISSHTIHSMFVSNVNQIWTVLCIQ